MSGSRQRRPVTGGLMLFVVRPLVNLIRTGLPEEQEALARLINEELAGSGWQMMRVATVPTRE